jgi:hypothetical protein
VPLLRLLFAMVLVGVGLRLLLGAS